LFLTLRAVESRRWKYMPTDFKISTQLFARPPVENRPGRRCAHGAGAGRGGDGQLPGHPPVFVPPVLSEFPDAHPVVLKKRWRFSVADTNPLEVTLYYDKQDDFYPTIVCAVE